ncbi:unnamed protein product, partial [Rotaria magnacalcarata]
MVEKIGGSGVQNSHVSRFISTLPSVMERPQSKNFRLMLIRSFRLCQVVLIMEITGGFGFNPVLSPA